MLHNINEYVAILGVDHFHAGFASRVGPIFATSDDGEAGKGSGITKDKSVNFSK